MKNRRYIIIGGSLFLALLLFLTEPATYKIHKGTFYGLEASVLEPLFFLIISVVVSTLILLFFSEKIFSLWKRKFMFWFLPLSILIIISGATEISYSWPTRTSLAITTGSIMVLGTLIFSLVQRFYHRVE